MDFQDKKTLYKVRQTILEMIHDRKYNIPEVENLNFEQFIIKYNNKKLGLWKIDSLISLIHSEKN